MTWLTSPAHARWLEAEGDRLLEFGRASRAPRRRVRLARRRRRARARPAGRAVDHLPDDARLRARPPDGPARTAARSPTTGSRRCAGGSTTTSTAAGTPRSVADGPTDDRQDGLRARVRRARRRQRDRAPAGRAARELLDEALERAARAASGTTSTAWSSSSGTRRSTTLDGYRGVNANMHTRRGAARRPPTCSATPSLRDRALRIVTRVVHDLGRAATSGGSPSTSTPHWTPAARVQRRRAGAPVPALRRDDRPLAGVGPAGAAPARRRSGDRRPGLAARRRAWRCSTRPCARAGRSTARTGSSTPSTGTAHPVVRERMHWVAAEATATAAALHAATGDPSYAAWYAHLVGARRRPASSTPSAGPGATSCRRRTAPSSVTWAGKPDAYHAVPGHPAPAAAARPRPSRPPSPAASSPDPPFR